MKVLYNLVIFCIFNVSLSKSKHKKEMSDSGSSEGDKLIEKIISADRFNDLADKIVDKALWKLNHMNSSSDFTGTEKYSTPDYNSSSNILRSKKRDHKRHKTAIDVEAVLKKKVIPLADLRFRYDHFIKGAKTVADKSDKNVKILRHDSSQESTEKNPSKSKVVQKSNENSSEATDDNDKNKKNPSSETSYVDENKMHIENVSNIVNTNKDEITTPKVHSGENQFGDEKVIVWGRKDESGDKTDSDRSDEKKGKENNEKKSNESDEADEPYRQRAEAENQTSALSTKDNDDENIINKDVLKHKGRGVKQLQLEHDDIFQKSKNLIRREGDKMYTFEKSPDYAEYHDKLAEARKTFTKNVT